jgi:DNA-binding transcriptional MerR regulator
MENFGFNYKGENEDDFMNANLFGDDTEKEPEDNSEYTEQQSTNNNIPTEPAPEPIIEGTNEEDIEHVKADVLRGGEEQLKYEGDLYNLDDIPNDMMFGTDAVAHKLGVTPQTIRNYSDWFSEYLSISRKGSHRQFNKTDIENLRRIMSLKETRGLTIEQLKSYLNNEFALDLAGNEETKADKLVSAMTDKMGAYFADLLEKNNQQLIASLPSSGEDVKSSVKELSDKLQSSYDIIEKQADLIEKQGRALTDLQNSVTEKLGQIEDTVNEQRADVKQSLDSTAQSIQNIQESQSHTSNTAELEKRYEQSQRRLSQALAENQSLANENNTLKAQTAKKKHWLFG